jgi:DNA-binding protein Alba|tara:strand:- start:2590 stop:2874 length:285 start_codon:yes stop_codon:yes gene_type:complete
LENQNSIQNENEFFVEDDPIMQSATDALFLLTKLGKISIKAKGLDIPNAVSIANIITDNFLKNKSKVDKINLDSKISNKDGRMISNIEIILLKN